MANSVYTLWSAMHELAPLTTYVEESITTPSPLQVLGFDSSPTGTYPKKHFINDLTTYLNALNPEITESAEWSHLVTTIEYSDKLDLKGLKKHDPISDISYVGNLINKIEELDQTQRGSYWTQVLKNTQTIISDFGLKTDLRDRQMADNLIWIKENYPNRKIICWGATSHFLYNSTDVRMKNPVNVNNV